MLINSQLSLLASQLHYSTLHFTLLLLLPNLLLNFNIIILLLIHLFCDSDNNNRYQKLEEIFFSSKMFVVFIYLFLIDNCEVQKSEQSNRISFLLPSLNYLLKKKKKIVGKIENQALHSLRIRM